MRLLTFPGVDSHLQLCWLRENRPGTLIAEFASASPSALGPALARLLPDLAPATIFSLHGNILDALPDYQDREVYLPGFDRLNWPRREEVLARTAFKLHGEALVPAGLPPAVLNNHYSRVLAAAAFEPCLPMSFDAPPDRIPAGLFSIWRTLPNERRAAYFRFLAPVSVALQTTLRELVERALFADLDHFSRLDLAIPALCYITSSPFPGRGRADFTYDLMRSHWLLSAFRLSRRPFELALDRLRDLCRTAGRTDLLALYESADARLILRQVRAGQLRTEPVFTAEQRIIDAFVLFASRVRACESSYALARLTASFLDQLTVRLHRFRVGDLSRHVPRLALVATRAAAGAFLEEELAA